MSPDAPPPPRPPQPAGGAPRPQAIFTREGECIVPGPLAQGPWDPGSQHGGAVCAALAQALEALPTSVPMRAARITFELLRAAPIAPLRLQARVARAGRRVQVGEASLCEISGARREVARATGLFVRTAAGLGLEDAPNRLRDRPLPLEPGAGVPPRIRTGALPGYLRAVDFVRADGEPEGARPATVWLRLRAEVFEGEPPSPLVRLAAVCDFASGVGNALDFSRWVAINPDLSLHVLREPRSEWIAVRGTTRILPDGIGQSVATLFDEQGEIASAQASLYVDRR